jgi:hypothetical protein
MRPSKKPSITAKHWSTSSTSAVVCSTTREIAGGRDSTEKALTNSQRLGTCHRWSNRFATTPNSG